MVFHSIFFLIVLKNDEAVSRVATLIVEACRVARSLACLAAFFHRNCEELAVNDRRLR